MVSDLRIGRTAMPSGICVSSAAALLAIALTGAFSASALAEDCEADPNQALSVAGGCLAIESHVSRPGGPLVVFIHGDSGISRRYTGQLDRIRDSVINLVVLARPGFRTRDGRMSTGPDSDTYDNYTPAVIDSLGSALRQLRKFHNASRPVLLGHSGGAMISGILMGRAPGVAEAAVLVAWACNTPKWRAWRELSAGKSGNWPNSLSAHDYLDQYPASSRIYALTGDVDDNTKPSFARACVEALRARNIKATLEIVERSGHNRVMRSEKVLEAIRAAVKP